MMCKKVICGIMIVTLGVINIGLSADIPDLAAWWSLNDGAGTTVVDSSGNGHDGQAYGDPAWVSGVHGGAMEFDGVDDWVEFPTTSEAQGFPTVNGEVTWALWLKTGAVTLSTPVIAVGPVGGAHVAGNRSITVEPSGAINLRGNNVGALVGVDTSATVTDNEWHHVAVAIAFETNGTSDTMQVYIDGDLNKGVVNDTININQYAGSAGDFVMAFGKRATFYTGLLDDVAVFGRVLSADEILTVMAGLSKELASGASPADGATDVLRDSDLSWTPGEFAVTHDVYFGTSFEDVNTATVPTASGLDVSSLDVGTLDFGKTYYWRVDEVNGTPDHTVFKGDVWSFTVEPYAIRIPVDIHHVTASSSAAANPPGMTVNGSGLDGSTHGTDNETMWLSDTPEMDPWLMFEFNSLQKLDHLLIWNSNATSEGFIGWGIKDVDIETSIDGVDWTGLGQSVQISRAPGQPTYDAPQAIDLNLALAKYVRLNILSNWGGLLNQYGVSEVQFYGLPVYARTPDPVSGSMDILPDSVVSWRAGRQAVQHTVTVGSDVNAVAEGSAASAVTSTNNIGLGSFDVELDQTYYWRVDEVNEAEAVSVWAGDVWNLTTQSYLTIDNFDSYNNLSPNRPFQAWLDGFGYSADEFFPVEYPGNGTGAGVGHDIWSPGSLYFDGTIMEATIARSGQSMPLYFNNTGGVSLSETQRTFDQAQDWTANGIKSLSLNLYGQPDNSGQLYLKINGTRIDYYGLTDALQRSSWIPWNIDLSTVAGNLKSVTSLTIGIDGAGATGVIYIDDIRLYPRTPETIMPVIPMDSDPNLVTYYPFEGNANDSQGNYPGTASGDPVYTTGKVGQALSLDKVDDIIVNTFDQDVTWPAYSVSLWAKTDLFNQVIYSSLFNNNSAGADFQIEVNGSDVYGYRGSGAGSIGPVSSHWVHLAVTCDGTQTQLYYNGLFVGTVNEARTQFGQIAIGANRGMNTLFGGTIDEVRVYNRALSLAEVAGLAGLTDEIPVAF